MERWTVSCLTAVTPACTPVPLLARGGWAGEFVQAKCVWLLRRVWMAARVDGGESGCGHLVGSCGGGVTRSRRQQVTVAGKCSSE